MTFNLLRARVESRGRAPSAEAAVSELIPLQNKLLPRTMRQSSLPPNGIRQRVDIRLCGRLSGCVERDAVPIDLLGTLYRLSATACTRQDGSPMPRPSRTPGLSSSVASTTTRAGKSVLHLHFHTRSGWTVQITHSEACSERTRPPAETHTWHSRSTLSLPNPRHLWLRAPQLSLASCYADWRGPSP